MNTNISAIAVRPEPAAARLPAQPAETKARIEQPEAVKPAQKEAAPDSRAVRLQMQEASEQLNRQMAKSGRDLSFSVDDVANKIVLTVKNQSGELVRQIPSETALRLAHSLDAVKGLLRDEQV